MPLNKKGTGTIKGYKIAPGANLHAAALPNTSLKGANLKGADLRDADLSYSDLSKADLSEAARGKVTDWVKGAKRKNNPGHECCVCGDPASLMSPGGEVFCEDCF